MTPQDAIQNLRNLTNVSLARGVFSSLQEATGINDSLALLEQVVKEWQELQANKTGKDD